jgi:hypothetical protein
MQTCFREHRAPPRRLNNTLSEFAALPLRLSPAPVPAAR